MVRAHVAAKKAGLQFIVGAEFTLVCGMKLVVLAATRRGYGELCQLITRGRRAAAKGSYSLTRADLAACVAPVHELAGEADCLVIWRQARPCSTSKRNAACRAGGLPTTTPARCGWAFRCCGWGRDAPLLAAAQVLAGELGIRCVARGDVHMHEPARRPLQDALTAIRHRVTLHEAGRRLFPNGERHLRTRAELARLYPPELLAETMAIAARCRFRLDELRYQYPREIVPEGETPETWLRKLVEEGARRHWPDGAPPRERTLIEKELDLIRQLGYEPFFLTVHDVVRYARGEGILCQGRVPRPTPSSATAWTSPPPNPNNWKCCSSASSRRIATNRRTSTWISSMNGARKSSSTSTGSTVGPRGAGGHGDHLWRAQRRARPHPRAGHR